MAPILDDDLDKPDTRDYGEFIYLYYLGFDSPREEDIVYDMPLFLEDAYVYRAMAGLTSDESSLILACAEEIDERVFDDFPEKEDLLYLKKFVGKRLNR
ncbi:hypothetical protein HNV12_02335 [Methanococcoides sp. SA1]|nr:hypothetical protein [Methanococcoides sp. SA1]